MSELFDSIHAGAEQAIAIARGEADPAAYKTRTFHPVDIKAIRAKVGMTQEAFSLAFGIDLNTLRQWERGARVPDGPAQMLLKVISQEPDAVGGRKTMPNGF